MPQVIIRIILWSLGYVALCLLPMTVALFGPSPEGRDFLIELGVALGMVGYVMLAIQFFTTGRISWIAPYFGSDAEIRFHRETGILALLFVFLHPAILIFADQEYLKYFDPTENFLRAVFLSLGSIALILIIVLSIWRVAIGLTYEWWLLTHGILACGVLVVGLAHALQVGHYVGEIGNQVVFIGLAILALGAYGYIRLLKPFRIRARPWKVIEVRPDCPEVYRLILEPDGHDGIDFRAGQYAWITIGRTKFVAQQHPFSFMSSDRQRDRVEFGIKQVGDFTGDVHAVSPGTPAYLDGPHGAFISDPRAEGLFCVVAGIGVTPVLSILRTARDQGDKRPMRLIYANPDVEHIPFFDDLESLSKDLNLTVIHVIEHAPEDWSGEVGLVDDGLIERQLHQMKVTDVECFICGPVPVIEIAEKALSGLDVPQWRIVSERFDLV